jgi:hypothetical protein
MRVGITRAGVEKRLSKIEEENAYPVHLRQHAFRRVGDYALAGVGFDTIHIGEYWVLVDRASA